MNKYLALGLLQNRKAKTELRKLKSMNNKPLSRKELLGKITGASDWEIGEIIDEEIKNRSRQEAIELIKFMEMNAEQRASGKFTILSNGDYLSPDQLYEKYLESKTREKEK